jgi:hypothetical protein
MMTCKQWERATARAVQSGSKRLNTVLRGNVDVPPKSELVIVNVLDGESTIL